MLRPQLLGFANTPLSLASRFLPFAELTCACLPRSLRPAPLQPAPQPGAPSATRMLAAAVAMGYLYQGPPFRLSYLGLGEPLCFAAFGPLATCAFYLAQVRGAGQLAADVRAGGKCSSMAMA